MSEPDKYKFILPLNRTVRDTIVPNNNKCLKQEMTLSDDDLACFNEILKELPFC